MNLVILAAGLSLVVTILLGPLVIPLLHTMKFGQRIRSDGPRRHLQKAGTPTMGGVMFLAGSATATAVIAWLARGTQDARGITAGLVVLLVTLGFGLVGFLDDFIKIALRRSLGLRAREKLLGQILVSLFLAIAAVCYLERGTAIVLPFSGFFAPGGVSIDLGWWGFIFFTIFVLLGTANAVNLTDGLDGLAAGVMVVASAAFALLALAAEMNWVAVVLGALAGGCLGFLYYNRYPARVFMGDTGSLALGGGLAAAAVLTKSELFLLFIGGVFVLETLSVILQVVSFQLTGKRIFRMAPLHHHFELAGWSETRVVWSFWVFGLALALVGLAGMYRLGG